MYPAQRAGCDYYVVHVCLFAWICKSIASFAHEPCRSTGAVWELFLHALVHSVCHAPWLLNLGISVYVDFNKDEPFLGTSARAPLLQMSGGAIVYWHLGKYTSAGSQLEHLTQYGHSALHWGSQGRCRLCRAWKLVARTYSGQHVSCEGWCSTSTFQSSV
jgi:hypothetical protein